MQNSFDLGHFKLKMPNKCIFLKILFYWRNNPCNILLNYLDYGGLQSRIWRSTSQTLSQEGLPSLPLHTSGQKHSPLQTAFTCAPKFHA